MKLMQGIRLSYNLQVYFFQDSFLFRFSWQNEIKPLLSDCWEVYI
jgi:hypothetical protein